MKRVYLAAFGSGMGHASRMSALAERLVASGDEVVFSSSGEVTRWLRARGYQCNDLPLVDVAYSRAGAFSAAASLRSLPPTLARLSSQVRSEVANLKRFSPTVVLSDSMASTILAAKVLRVRSVVVLNQLKLISSPRTPKALSRMLTGGSVAIGGWFWEMCDEVLIPDLPPPFTISERNLWNAGGTSKRARYIGFLTPRRVGPPDERDPILRRWVAESRRRKVFWQISGPPATRASFLAKGLAVAKTLGDRYMFVLTAGNPPGGTVPSPVPGGFLYQWCKDSGAYIDSCDAVVSRAGHVSISDYILRARPSILVPIQAQTEQMGNAAKAERLGISITIDEGALDPATIDAAIKQLSAPGYEKRANEMKALAERYDAAGSVLSVLEKVSRAPSSS